MVFKSHQLLSELQSYVKAHILFVEGLKKESEALLNFKENEATWSVLECIEHLNLYAVFYNEEITKRMETSKVMASSTFKSGFLGNKFSLDMLPKEGMKTMKAFKSKNPICSSLKKEVVLNSFIAHQEKLLQLLEIAETKSLSKIKTSLTIPFLKFKLGDTFRFIIFHNERHIVQAKKIM